MHCRVYLLRRRGRRLPRKEIENGLVYEGELSAYYMNGKGERFFVASLTGPRPRMVRVLPDLYEPALVALEDRVMILRGFERLGDGDSVCAVVQECSCSIDLLREMQRSTISQENRSGCGRSSSSSLFQRRVARARGEATMGKRSFDQAVLERLCDLDCATALALLCCHCKPDAALPLKN
jgi:hypothetical protein